jgi:hypothetical protein
LHKQDQSHYLEENDKFVLANSFDQVNPLGRTFEEATFENRDSINEAPIVESPQKSIKVSDVPEQDSNNTVIQKIIEK